MRGHRLAIVLALTPALFGCPKTVTIRVSGRAEWTLGDHKIAAGEVFRGGAELRTAMYGQIKSIETVNYHGIATERDAVELHFGGRTLTITADQDAVHQAQWWLDRYKPFAPLCVGYSGGDARPAKGDRERGYAACTLPEEFFGPASVTMPGDSTPLPDVVLVKVTYR